MFEDFTGGDADSFEVDERASDRTVLYAIWTRGEIGDLDVAELWALLVRRYPLEPRFPLMQTFAEAQRAGFGPDDAEYLLRTLETLASATLPAGALRDLLSVERAWHGALFAKALGARFEALASRFDGARADAEEASQRLARVERTLLEELHDRTLGNRPLAPKVAAASGANDYRTLIARSEGKDEIAYAVSAHLVVGDRVRHPAFGVGVVIARRGNKAEIAFADARRTLVCR